MMDQGQHSIGADDDWEIDDTLLEHTDNPAVTAKLPASPSSVSKRQFVKETDVYQRLSLKDLAAHSSTSKCLPYTRIRLVR